MWLFCLPFWIANAFHDVCNVWTDVIIVKFLARIWSKLFFSVWICAFLLNHFTLVKRIAHWDPSTKLILIRIVHSNHIFWKTVSKLTAFSFELIFPSCRFKIGWKFMSCLVNFVQREPVSLRHFEHVHVHLFRCRMLSQIIFNLFIGMLLHEDFIIDVIHAFSKLLKSVQGHFLSCVHDWINFMLPGFSFGLIVDILTDKAGKTANTCCVFHEQSVDWNKAKDTCSILESIYNSLCNKQFLNCISLVSVDIDPCDKLGFSSNDFLIDFILLDLKVIAEPFATELQWRALRRNRFLWFWIATAHEDRLILLGWILNDRECYNFVI